MKRLLRSFLATLLTAASLAIPVTLTAGSGAAKADVGVVTWAPAATATIRPGSETVTEGSGQCTANFIFQDASNVYIGQAAHCSGTGAATETDGCLAQSLPLGTAVQIEGADNPGTMVYNSWLTMQANGESDPDTCAYNDLALVRLHPDDVAKVNPSVPFWGGPTGIARSSGGGENVYSYGNSSLRLGITALKPKRGVSLGSSNGNWTQTVYTVTPGIPGDSGSAFLNSTGAALGTLSTLAAAPFAASNGVAGLANELDYLRANSSFSGVQLVNGTEAFNGGQLPIGLGL